MKRAKDGDYFRPDDMWAVAILAAAVWLVVLLMGCTPEPAPVIRNGDVPKPTSRPAIVVIEEEYR